MTLIHEKSEQHNRLAGRIVASIVRPSLADGGSPSDVLVLLESVVVGCILAIVKLGGDEKVLDVLVERVRGRLAEVRLKDTPSAGNS